MASAWLAKLFQIRHVLKQRNIPCCPNEGIPLEFNENSHKDSNITDIILWYVMGLRCNIFQQACMHRLATRSVVTFRWVLKELSSLLAHAQKIAHATWKCRNFMLPARSWYWPVILRNSCSRCDPCSEAEGNWLGAICFNVWLCPPTPPTPLKMQPDVNYKDLNPGLGYDLWRHRCKVFSSLPTYG